ncbi:MAG TPA: glycosyl transferase, partial [Thermoanaerobaculia bacterium]|nr:glycosyl transferase [Thermoanaerobaculia bacterium]
RRRLSPAAYLGEPLLNPVPWLLALATAATAGAAPTRLGAAAVAGLAAKLGADAHLARRLRGHRLALGDLVWIPFKDLVIGAVWLVGAFRTTFTWRGHLLRVGTGSRLSRVAPKLGTAPGGAGDTARAAA